MKAKHKNSYHVRRATGPVPLSGDAGEGAWAEAAVGHVDVFPWFTEGEKEGTEVRLLYDARALYVQFIADDKWIFSQVRELNGPVCTDDCVELFFCPRPSEGAGYLNFEANCCGVMLLGYGDGREVRRRISRAGADEISVATSVEAPTKQEEPGDDGWWLAAALPFDTLSQFSGLTIAPCPGTHWTGNFYRCGGRTNQQYASWNGIDTPRPDFHRPEFFGDLYFD